MTEKIELSIKELTKIVETLDKFQKVSHITLTNDRSGGIGNTLTLEFGYYINDTIGRFSTTITDYNDW